MELFRLIAGTVFLVCGLFIFGVAVIGLFRFRYVLNRVHVAAKCDSLAVMLICIGLMFYAGTLGAILKLLLVIVLVWLANPVASHLICKVEVETNEHLEEECEVEGRP
ncbi:MAG: monovalent cation/H(+) antiporter subunit G [Lachnospiraceae bacterium]|nr:monovalent cation/H(+) antiporter subunit G [Lachnospiraceae bacterium]